MSALRDAAREVISEADGLGCGAMIGSDNPMEHALGVLARALSADRGEAAVILCHRLHTGGGKWCWVNGAPNKQSLDDARTFGWKLELAYAATPPSQSAEGADGECAKCGAPTDPDYGHVGDCNPAAPSQVSDAVLPPLPSPCELRNYTGNVPFMYYTADQMRHYLLDGLAAQPQPGRMEGWQPIETAPKDGSRVLLWSPKWSAPHTGHIGGPRGWESSIELGPFLWQPTHWQPLPAAPTAGGDA